MLKSDQKLSIKNSNILRPLALLSSFVNYKITYPCTIRFAVDSVSNRRHKQEQVTKLHIQKLLVLTCICRPTVSVMCWLVRLEIGLIGLDGMGQAICSLVAKKWPRCCVCVEWWCCVSDGDGFCQFAVSFVCASPNYFCLQDGVWRFVLDVWC